MNITRQQALDVLAKDIAHAVGSKNVAMQAVIGDLNNAVFAELNNPDPHDLNRFVIAQADCYERAVVWELLDGRKETHWMWFVFPQKAGLGTSDMSRHYAIKSLAEARAYLAHPVLGPRLLECMEFMLNTDTDLSAEDILGHTDAMKLRSCCELFAAVSDVGNIFEMILEEFFPEGLPSSNEVL